MFEWNFVGLKERGTLCSHVKVNSSRPKSAMFATAQSQDKVITAAMALTIIVTMNACDDEQKDNMCQVCF